MERIDVEVAGVRPPLTPVLIVNAPLLAAGGAGGGVLLPPPPPQASASARVRAARRDRENFMGNSLI
jgi:hypothetical protein